MSPICWIKVYTCISEVKRASALLNIVDMVFLRHARKSVTAILTHYEKHVIVMMLHVLTAEIKFMRFKCYAKFARNFSWQFSFFPSVFMILLNNPLVNVGEPG